MEQKETKPKFKIKLFGRFLAVRGMVEMGALIAMAVILDLKVFKFTIGEAQSFSLTMLPLIILALRFPILDSFIGIGIIYGFTTNLIDGYGLHTFPLDYLLAYGSLSLISLFSPLVFKKNKTVLLNFVFLTIAIVVGVTARILWSSLSSVVFYDYTYWAGIVYNAPTMAVSGLICLVLLFMLYQTLVMFHNKLPEHDNAEQ